MYLEKATKNKWIGTLGARGLEQDEKTTTITFETKMDSSAVITDTPFQDLSMYNRTKLAACLLATLKTLPAKSPLY